MQKSSVVELCFRFFHICKLAVGEADQRAPEMCPSRPRRFAPTLPVERNNSLLLHGVWSFGAVLKQHQSCLD